MTIVQLMYRAEPGGIATDVGAITISPDSVHVAWAAPEPLASLPALRDAPAVILRVVQQWGLAGLYSNAPRGGVTEVA